MPSATTDPSQLAREAHARLARTVNIAPDFGGRMEQGGWTLDIGRSHLEACAHHGFTAIRLLIYLTAHSTPGGLDPHMLRRLEEITGHAESLGLAVAISNHRDPQLIADPEPHLPAALAAVAQLASVFEGRGTDLILEPVAEPQDALDPIWNRVAGELIGAVRGRDQNRTILLGPRTVNNARFLGELSLPEDERNLIIGIHHYWPVTFTMQGEMWLGEDHISGNPKDWLGTTWDQTPAQEAELRTGFDQVAEWGKMTGRPLFLAEFGTTSNADPASRARWTRFNRRLAEEHCMPWGVWSFAPVFAIYDLTTATFHPDLLPALMD
ncbi:MAG TPA: cellulase family glycosylhydrolase [Trebonia sp.]|nr:cellulase family glycosylhydrolase [Trebonia sp.]